MRTHNCEVFIRLQYNIGAGIDGHKDIMVVHISSKDGRKSETKEFKTFTDDLETHSINTTSTFSFTKYSVKYNGINRQKLDTYLKLKYN